MRIAITGATGYLGARLCRNLSEIGHEVIAVYRNLDSAHDQWRKKLYGVIEGDIRDVEIINKIANSGADAVIHLVSLDHRLSESDPKIVNEINVLPTWQLLDTCNKTGVSKFIYFSTMQVYGRVPNQVVDENFPANTVNAYGLTHLLCEEIATHFNNNFKMNVISVRLSNSYGVPVFHENNCWWLAINDLCKSAIEKKEIRLLSDGSPQRDFIHGNDVAIATEVLLQNAPKAKENIYNISSGETKTIMELALMIKAEYLKRYHLEIPIYTPNGIYKENSYQSPSLTYQICNQKIKDLGYSPKLSLQDGIQELFSYLEKKIF